MKTFLKTLGICLLGAVTVTSCNDSNDNSMDEYYKQLERQEQIFDSTLNVQKDLIENYVDANLNNATEDTVNVAYDFIEKVRKRGIWYRIESEPTDNTYQYKLNSIGEALIYPKIKLKYTAKLLNGTVVESDLVGTDYNIGVASAKITRIWHYSFLPYNIPFNGNPRKPYGLTKDGLKKGSKIIVVTPSAYAYGTRAQDKIPSNSPLVYEFEVLSIE